MDKRVIQYIMGWITHQNRRDLLEQSLKNESLQEEIVEFHKLDALVGLSPSAKDLVAGKKSLAAFKARRIKPESPARTRPFLRYAFLAVLLFICIGSMFMLPRWLGSHPSQESALLEFSSPFGHVSKFILPDSSAVWLNANSTLKYPPVFAGQRKVYLTGEALFDVSKDRMHPFVVSTGRIDVKVTGTLFDVFSNAGEMPKVALLEGAVEVMDVGKEFKKERLSPGQQLSLTSDGFSVSEFEEDPIAWSKGYYCFNELTLEEIVRQLERFYGIRVELEDDELLQHRYTGTFRREDGPFEILRLLQGIHPFRVRSDDSHSVISLSADR